MNWEFAVAKQGKLVEEQGISPQLPNGGELVLSMPATLALNGLGTLPYWEMSAVRRYADIGDAMIVVRS
jgi:hypothetical protein